MSIRWLSIIAGIILFLPRSLSAETALEARIMQILSESSLNADLTGVAVMSVNHGDIMASVNGDYPLNPASCAKIVTGATALSTLGPGYRFETNFYTDRHFQGGALHNLYVAGTGDPSLVTEEMERIVYELAGKGVRAVTGDIVVDDSFFDGPWYPRKDGDDERAFTAQTSAFSFNFNSAKFVMTPADMAGRMAQVTIDPPTSYIRIMNKMTTGGRFRANIAARESSEAGETFLITGSIPARAEPQSFYRSVRDPSLYAGNVLKDMLARNGVAISGAVRKGLAPQGAAQILRWQSKPLTEIVRDMMKFSNNFTAEQITKHLGAVKKGVPGSTAKGVEALEGFLSSLSIPRGSYTFENGSGLSSVSRISALQLVKVLASAYRSRSMHPHFIESLSILGVDGTMKSWKAAPHLHGWLRAKTGSLANVSALAGYVPMQNGEIAAFAILANGFKKGRYSAHEAELMIASAIAEAK